MLLALLLIGILTAAGRAGRANAEREMALPVGLRSRLESARRAAIACGGGESQSYRQTQAISVCSRVKRLYNIVYV
jgi:hypothetical protein